MLALKIFDRLSNFVHDRITVFFKLELVKTFFFHLTSLRAYLCFYTPMPGIPGSGTVKIASAYAAALGVECCKSLNHLPVLRIFLFNVKLRHCSTIEIYTKSEYSWRASYETFSNSAIMVIPTVVSEIYVDLPEPKFNNLVSLLTIWNKKI